MTSTSGSGMNDCRQLFSQLRIEKYLSRFIEEEMEPADLLLLSSKEQISFIPTTGPRVRLINHLCRECGGDPRVQDYLRNKSAFDELQPKSSEEGRDANHASLLVNTAEPATMSRISLASEKLSDSIRKDFVYQKKSMVEKLPQHNAKDGPNSVVPKSGPAHRSVNEQTPNRIPLTDREISRFIENLSLNDCEQAGEPEASNSSPSNSAFCQRTKRRREDDAYRRGDFPAQEDDGYQLMQAGEYMHGEGLRSAEAEKRAKDEGQISGGPSGMQQDVQAKGVRLVGEDDGRLEGDVLKNGLFGISENVSGGEIPDDPKDGPSKGSGTSCDGEQDCAVFFGDNYRCFETAYSKPASDDAEEERVFSLLNEAAFYEPGTPPAVCFNGDSPAKSSGGERVVTNAVTDASKRSTPVEEAGEEHGEEEKDRLFESGHEQSDTVGKASAGQSRDAFEEFEGQVLFYKQDSKYGFARLTHGSRDQDGLESYSADIYFNAKGLLFESESVEKGALITFNIRIDGGLDAGAEEGRERSSDETAASSSAEESRPRRTAKRRIVHKSDLDAFLGFLALEKARRKKSADVKEKSKLIAVNIRRVQKQPDSQDVRQKTRTNGRVIWFNREYGYIKQGDSDVYFNCSSVSAGDLPLIKPDVEVSCVLSHGVSNGKAKLVAQDVRVARAALGEEIKTAADEKRGIKNRLAARQIHFVKWAYTTSKFIK